MAAPRPGGPATWRPGDPLTFCSGRGAEYAGEFVSNADRHITFTQRPLLVDGAPRATVDMEFEQIGDMTRVLVTETRDEPLRDEHKEIGLFWPASLASLVNWLNSGQGLPAVFWRAS